MEIITPYDMFSPIHLAWLYRRHEKGQDITAADLRSIAENQPEAVNDSLYRELSAKAAAGTLKRRRGRKPILESHLARLAFANVLIDEEVEAIWADRRSGRRARLRSDESPIHEAAETVARLLRFSSGRSLLNHLSRLGFR